MEDREEILEALRTIQNVCKKHSDCKDCPFEKGTSCIILAQTPIDWKIRKASTWKAFED